MKTNILISIVIALAMFSCSSNEDNLIPAPTVSTDSVFVFTDALSLIKDTVNSKGDVYISADSVVNLSYDLIFKAGSEIKQVDIQFGGVPTKNGDNTPYFSAKNSSLQPYTQIINDVEGWWPNVSFNGGFDSALASKMRIVIPKAKGEIVMNVIVHDKTGKEAYLTRKITVKK